MHWKVKLEGDDNTLTKLASGNSAAAQVSRDGVDWFLESTDFEMLSDHLEVKDRANQILGSILSAGAATANIGMGPIYRIHYDNSKTVFR
jgi:hypothetical protein